MPVMPVMRTRTAGRIARAMPEVGRLPGLVSWTNERLGGPPPRRARDGHAADAARRSDGARVGRDRVRARRLEPARTRDAHRRAHRPAPRRDRARAPPPP